MRDPSDAGARGDLAHLDRSFGIARDLRATSWRLTPGLWWRVRTIAPIIAVSRIIPAAWKK